MAAPSELSLAEIREFILNNGCKVTNHALVKHFKKFLTNPNTQNEARKKFKDYVNVLAKMRTEGNEKFLILKNAYIHVCPTEDSIGNLDSPASPGARSLNFESDGSPFRQPPPYRPPPEVLTPPGKPMTMDIETKTQFKDCIDEFKNAVSAIVGQPATKSISAESSRKNSVELRRSDSEEPPLVPPRKRNSTEKSISRESSIDLKDPPSRALTDESNKENVALIDKNERSNKDELDGNKSDTDNKISVKEAMRKFNRIASEEEAKVLSPPNNKKKIEKAEKPEDKIPSNKMKEWMVSAARGNYQELAKLASEYPHIVKIQDPTTTALHWAAKHGNENVVKLIAGTHHADCNARTNGGYTPLHIAMQFERDNIFELLCNVYKADRNIIDWSGKKPLDYRKQQTSVSALTFSKIKARKKQSEKDLGFLRIGSLNVRVKKTTEAFSNFLGVGTNNQTTRPPLTSRTSAPPTSSYFENNFHKNWGSADNIPQDSKTHSMMPPPKYGPVKKRKSKRPNDFLTNSNPGMNTIHSHSQSMPTTPSQVRAPISTLAENPSAESVGDSDSDSACGFDSNWNATDGIPNSNTTTNNANTDYSRPTYI